MIHDLKCWPELFTAILSGAKTAEFRKADRLFGSGDRLRLREWDPGLLKYTNRQTELEITHVAKLDEFGAPGYVLLSLATPSITVDQCATSVDPFNKPIALEADDVRQLLEAAEEFLAYDDLGIVLAAQLRDVVKRVNELTPRQYDGDQLEF